MELWERYKKEKTSELRNEIAENYINLVKYLAKRIVVPLPNGLEKDDLVQYGFLGLFEATGILTVKGKQGTYYYKITDKEVKIGKGGTESGGDDEADLSSSLYFATPIYYGLVAIYFLLHLTILNLIFS